MLYLQIIMTNIVEVAFVFYVQFKLVKINYIKNLWVASKNKYLFFKKLWYSSAFKNRNFINNGSVA